MKKKASVILVDPPWSYETWSKKGQQRSAEHHYDTFTMQDIYDLPVQELADDNCALFLWVSTPNLPACLEVFNHWGFTYKTKAFSWVKRKPSNATLYGIVDRHKAGELTEDQMIDLIATNAFKMNLGHYTRAGTEDCYLGVKGSLSRINADVRQVTVEYEDEMVPAPQMRHSEKPYIFHQKIERLFGDVPRIELFAREQREGWTCLGNEIDGLDIREAIRRLLE